MNNYDIKLIVDGNEILSFDAEGPNAMQAFEDSNEIWGIPVNVPIKVIATNPVNDLSVEFKVYQK